MQWRRRTSPAETDGQRLPAPHPTALHRLPLLEGEASPPEGPAQPLGKTANLALCESGHQDAHQRSEWSIIAIATESAAVDRTLTQAERLLEETLDAQLLGAQREWLC